jgi:hypothetical protein
MFLTLKNQITEHTSQWAVLVLTWFFIKHRDKVTNSINGSVTTAAMAESLTTALNLENPLVNELFTLNMTSYFGKYGTSN